MGQSIMASIRHLLAGFVSLTIVALIQAQTTPPDASNPGCPPPPDPLGNEGKHCFSQGTTCVATKGGYPKQFASGGQVYRIFRTRNWWFCGKAAGTAKEMVTRVELLDNVLNREEIILLNHN